MVIIGVAGISAIIEPSTTLSATAVFAVLRSGALDTRRPLLIAETSVVPGSE